MNGLPPFALEEDAAELDCDAVVIDDGDDDGGGDSSYVLDDVDEGEVGDAEDAAE